MPRERENIFKRGRVEGEKPEDLFEMLTQLKEGMAPFEVLTTLMAAMLREMRMTNRTLRRMADANPMISKPGEFYAPGDEAYLTFLFGVLKDGPKYGKDVEAVASERGLSISKLRAIKRISEDFGCRKDAGAGWLWYIRDPNKEGPKKRPGMERLKRQNKERLEAAAQKGLLEANRITPPVKEEDPVAQVPKGVAYNPDQYGF